MSKFYEEDPENGESFRKKKEAAGIKGYWLVVIVVVVLGGTLYASMLFRESLPPIDFLDKPERLTGPVGPPPRAGMEMN